MIERPLTWDEIFEKLTEKQDLSDLQITWAMAQILDGLASNDQIKNFLLLLKEVYHLEITPLMKTRSYSIQI